ncbi:hypothetical protein [Listeria booriae]|uniref:Uncharacterized protein n=1 Tax=Listeria booriae TaxID=1552123 RepID=A0A7X0XV20_9LIST|nr:hypothetical protein [Listeria booriae]MBC1780560.1 hypothetical protein [Listeria booriae]MBC2305811.1 hypothetical protein [Listeria booriae]MDT0112508.1 hypothetical protein [Listeria booriae]
MDYPIAIDKEALYLYDMIQYPIKFCRAASATGTVVEYRYHIFKSVDSDNRYIIIMDNSEFLAAPNWLDSDLALFRFYLDDKYKKLPVYADLGNNESSYIFAGA